MNKMIQKTAAVLVSVGALAWGAYAFGYNIVEMLLGVGALATTVYALIGLAGAMALIQLFR
jgi:uncharacterized membrane protein YuzA (DUF378 family)